MSLQIFWFVTLGGAVRGLGAGGFRLLGSMLMVFGRSSASRYPVTPTSTGAVLNTIGPVWDGNEVWLITAGGAMFAAFPGMYATMFSGLYPLLAILVAMIVRVRAIEWRGKVDDRPGATAPISPSRSGWVPAVRGGHLRALLRGLPVDAEHQIALGFGDVLNPYTILGGAFAVRAVPAARRGVRDR